MSEMFVRLTLNISELDMYTLLSPLYGAMLSLNSFRLFVFGVSRSSLTGCGASCHISTKYASNLLPLNAAAAVAPW